MEQPHFLVWSVKDTAKNSVMKNQIDKFKNDGDKTLLVKILEQFGLSYRPKVYQNNYDPNMLWGNGSVENQYLQNFYIHRTKKDVFMKHNWLTIAQREFAVDD